MPDGATTRAAEAIDLPLPLSYSFFMTIIVGNPEGKSRQKEEESPNILFIFADAQCFSPSGTWETRR